MIATEEQARHIVGILKAADIYCDYPVLDGERECDDGPYPYVPFDDRIYLDGNITFDKMAEIVDYLRGK